MGKERWCSCWESSSVKELSGQNSVDTHPCTVSSCFGGFRHGPQFLGTMKEQQLPSGPVQRCKVTFYSARALSKAKPQPISPARSELLRTPQQASSWSLQRQTSSEASCPAKTNLLNAPTAGSTDGRLPTRTIQGWWHLLLL